ncbi:MAG TPA: PQQ-dependent sugar dehydrogenase [Thermoanaerobaculia bacterium]|nr:PQQ-dependent sugar dehydrogenase [Thermoanaerobaculia bacterium]
MSHHVIPPRARRLAALAFVLIAASLAPSLAAAATLPAGFVESTVAAGLVNPTAMAISRDGRIFIAEQPGRVRVVKNGKLLAKPFVSLNVNAEGERGLLGVALHPDFPRTPWVYVYYTAVKPKLHNRLSRFTARGDRGRPGSELRLLDLPQLGPTNHNGGAIHFGPDGMLYLGVGENGIPAHAQSLASPLGKILRVDDAGRFPNDNPFLGQTTGQMRAIWALGLRNPFTFAFSPSGRMFVNDVGAGAFEEIDEGIRGANYGWPATEGPTGDPRFVSPLFFYNHAGGSCAITGGAFYEPSAASGLFPPDFRGDYYYADLCAGWIRRVNPGTGQTSQFAAGIGNPVDLDVDAAGNLYYVAYGEGRIVRVSYVGG